LILESNNTFKHQFFIFSLSCSANKFLLGSGQSYGDGISVIVYSELSPNVLLS